MDINPEKMAQVTEKYLGKFWGRLLIRLALVCGLLGIVGLGLYWFLGNLVGGVIWPFLTKLFGADQGGITLDNIEAIVTTLTISIALLVMIFAAFVVAVIRIFRRRAVPQEYIDALADHRSEGIKILNRIPDDPQNLNDTEHDAFVSDWRSQWNEWRDKVLKTLTARFTRAETLSFQRLGLIPERTFPFAVNPEHNHCLMQLAKQLVILEDLIQRHQERR